MPAPARRPHPQVLRALLVPVLIALTTVVTGAAAGGDLSFILTTTALTLAIGLPVMLLTYSKEIAAFVRARRAGEQGPG